MEFHLPILFFIFFIISLRGYADESSLVYWHKMLPNTPIPKAITHSLHPSEWMGEKQGTSVVVGKGGVGVETGGKPYGKPGTHVSVGKGGVGVETGGKPGTHVSVGKGGVGVETGGKPYGKPGGTHVSVGKGGVGVETGKKPYGKPGTHVGVGKGGVTVVSHGKHKPVYVGVHPGANPFVYNYAATETQLHDDPTVALFFLQRDLIPGTKKTLHFPRNQQQSAAGFLSRGEAESIPFSTAEFPAILGRFNVDPKSKEASIMKQTVEECDQTSSSSAGEKRYCATSLESMLDFAVSRIGASVAAVSTDTKVDDGNKKEFVVKGVKDISKGGEVVACHKANYPYAVFYCHTTKKTAAYKVDLGEVEAVAVCHKDTSAWNPKHLAFQVLKVKPGSVPVCHFLPGDHLVWVRN